MIYIFVRNCNENTNGKTESNFFDDVKLPKKINSIGRPKQGKTISYKPKKIGFGIWLSSDVFILYFFQ